MAGDHLNNFFVIRDARAIAKDAIKSGGEKKEEETKDPLISENLPIETDFFHRVGEFFKKRMGTIFKRRGVDESDRRGRFGFAEKV